MSRKLVDTDNASDRSASVPAGEFSAWLSCTEASLRSGDGGADVPCGACRGCCRSSMFIHIRPEETQTLRRIPRALLFPAPGLPKGHVLMGYGDQGQCPMFVNNQCSIYEDRPQTCRDYDCRVFAATGVLVDAETQPEIARRVQEWAFTYAAEEGREKDRSVKAAAAFLTKNKDLFPSGSLPGYPVQLAALAVRVRRVISQMSARDHRDKAPLGDAAIASGILEEIREDTPGRK